MSDTENQAADDQQGEVQIQMRVLGQYIRDLSFENIIVQQNIEDDIEPAISINVNLDARKASGEHHYEVMMKLNIHAKDTDSDKAMFLLELDYAGLFEVIGVPQDQLHPFLLIECPRMLFPFARRIVSDMTRDGGFVPLNLENIDFVQLYRHELVRRQKLAEQEQDGAEADTTIN